MQLFIILIAALVGGYIAKKLKMQPLIGYIVAGITVKSFFVIDSSSVKELAELGTTLLLFSIGLELSLTKFKGNIRKIVFASVLQIATVTTILFFVLKIFSFNSLSSIVLALGFSLSSTAVVVKMLIDRGESETVHGKLMIGWLLVQDLAVIPMMIIIPMLGLSQSGAFLLGIFAILKAVIIIAAAVILGKHVIPSLIHRVAILNSRELMVLTSVSLAVGTAITVSRFGISASLGAFIAGFVISESQENHSVFAETRPLRDLFVALFFVTLGFFVSFSDIYMNLFLIISITSVVLLSKFLVVGAISILFKFKGKTSVITALGLSQVGEFSFILFTTANVLGLISDKTSTLGISVTLLTLILTPMIHKLSMPLWRFLGSKSKIFSTLDKVNKDGDELTNHIIICGYGRVGRWIGHTLKDLNIDFVVIDLDPNIVQECKERGLRVIHGDPIEKEVLKIAGILTAKAIVIAIPDRISHESIITHVQTLAPQTKIISRVHFDEDYEKLKTLKVNKLVQPEFEAAASIVKSILLSMGKDSENINKSIKSMRMSHAKI